ncbi:SDR family NAD(P)-dependent oxidoreductase [Mucilaginibacter rubeus]|uniref:SDR family NAD(P)-dependent oxidoreductase n=1 Tax=Mucilaginibacter rubeus TaxID=2027860 RepID=A0AAE6JJR2_9SPHI|nr:MULTISPECIES: SDR family NAD(P)-dependent oxidoreductase [Mucilaginibacter]QEM07164.1 SDR family NAD(P)-dependent oxidoreductase [Mucilaginibacter rubeus]QEM19618.1 SDR family NAD(P)-dependent oxidoreductase [Mucilaginibacter gossypii]QTE43690.1 SDR family NAD(P)-dependent oxidoreductase [Mucilaginibacter rubeus]QTE50290.1 SDR family NAD(P)-dependent oxidoreductase [Mucilaginibacter rubeus]QTE55377.1 SDR family NAD(P)-dependent oxidoreductase [Mucilaginibacter rubeus]
MNITNKTVLITGGGSGIGFEIAKLLTAQGNKVILVGRTESKLQEAVKSLDNAVAIVGDINSESDIKKLIAQVTAEYPELSVLINNAGRAFAYTHAENANAFSKATEEFATNYFSLIRLTEGFLPILKAQDEAAIVNVTSVVGYLPAAATPSYSDSKAAAHSYTLSLRHTLAKDTNIKVFELMPPLVNTEFSREIGGEEFGMSPVTVAEEFLEGVRTDDYEIKVGQTAGLRQLYLSDPQAAFNAINQAAH